jgi:hypothetical protein
VGFVRNDVATWHNGEWQESLPTFSSEVSVSKFRTQAPWEFLLSASRNTLQSYELSRLAHASNLRKEIITLLDQWTEENTAATLARWLIEQRENSISAGEEPAVSETAGANGHSASDNVLPDHVIPPNGSRSRF